MKRDNREWAGRFRGYAAAFVAVIMLLFPGSASVLCIAPGGHIAIEDINATCCKTSGIIAPDACQPDNGFSAAGGCQNCTDLFIAPDWQMAISKSSPDAATNLVADECPANRFGAGASLPLFRLGAIAKLDAPNPVAESVPLRC